MTQGWYATTVPPCCPSCHHMIRPSLIRDHRNFGTCGEKNDNVTSSTLTSEKVGWRKAGMLQQYHLAALHVTTWLGHLSSEIIATLEQPGCCLTSNEVFTNTHMPRTNFHANMQNTCHIKCSKHACLVRRSRSLARRSSRLLHLFRNLRQSRNGY